MPFHKIDGAHVVVKTKGLYRQLDVYAFDNLFFAKRGGGFTPLYKNGTGNADDVLLEFVVPPSQELHIGKLGRLIQGNLYSGLKPVPDGLVKNNI